MPGVNRAKLASFRVSPVDRQPARDVGGYRFPNLAVRKFGMAGNHGPRKGACFPEQIAAVFELHRSAVRWTRVWIDGGHGAAEHMTVERAGAGIGGDLQVHAAARSERPARFDERASGAQIDERHRMSGPERRACQLQQLLQEPGVVSPID